MPAFFQRSLLLAEQFRGLVEVATVGRLVAVSFTSILVATGIYLVRFGVNLPLQDEWDVTAQWFQVGSTWEWITLRHNEHRFVLGRALWALGMSLSGFDFRVGGWITLAMLAFSAAWLLRTAVRVQGRASLADVIVPAVLLNAGHCFNLLMGYQVVFAATTLCACGLLQTAMTARDGDEWRSGLVATFWLALMAGNGGFGIGFAPAVASWIGFLAWRCRRRSAWHALFLMLAPGLVLGYVFWNYATLPPAVGNVARPTLNSVLAVGSGYLGIGLGSILTDVEMSLSGWVPAIVAVVVLAHVLAGARLLQVLITSPQERPRAMGFLAVLGGHLAVALGISLSRDSALADRYVTPATIGLLVCWATGRYYGLRSQPWRGGGIALVVLAALGIATANSLPGRHYVVLAMMRGPLLHFQHDMQEGMPLSFLAGKYGHSYGVLIHDRTAPSLESFHQHHVHAFRSLTIDPPLRAQPLRDLPVPIRIPTSPVVREHPGIVPATWKIEPPRGHIEGLRLALEQDDDAGYQVFILHWNDSLGQDRSAFAYGPFFAGRGSLAIWINGPASNVRMERRGQGEGPKIVAAEWLLR